MEKSVPTRPNRSSWRRTLVVFDVIIESWRLHLTIFDRRTALAQHPRDELAWRRPVRSPFYSRRDRGYPKGIKSTNRSSVTECLAERPIRFRRARQKRRYILGRVGPQVALWAAEKPPLAANNPA